MQAQILIDGGQCIQRLAATGFRLAAVVKDIPDADTAMRACLAAMTATAGYAVCGRYMSNRTFLSAVRVISTI